MKRVIGKLRVRLWIRPRWLESMIWSSAPVMVARVQSREQAGRRCPLPAAWLAARTLAPGEGGGATIAGWNAAGPFAGGGGAVVAHSESLGGVANDVEYIVSK